MYLKHLVPKHLYLKLCKNKYYNNYCLIENDIANKLNN